MASHRKPTLASKIRDRVRSRWKTMLGTLSGVLTVVALSAMLGAIDLTPTPPAGAERLAGKPPAVPAPVGSIRPPLAEVAVFGAPGGHRIADGARGRQGDAQVTIPASPAIPQVVPSTSGTAGLAPTAPAVPAPTPTTPPVAAQPEAAGTDTAETPAPGTRAYRHWSDDYCDPAATPSPAPEEPDGT